jgi:hypothetical protein
MGGACVAGRLEEYGTLAKGFMYLLYHVKDPGKCGTMSTQCK